MKYLKQATMIFLLATGAASADPIEGLWRTAPDDHGDVGYIRISACDAAYCGRLERAENSAGQAITPDTIGTMIVWDLPLQPMAPMRDASTRLIVIKNICRGLNWPRTRSLLTAAS